MGSAVGPVRSHDEIEQTGRRIQPRLLAPGQPRGPNIVWGGKFQLGVEAWPENPQVSPEFLVGQAPVHLQDGQHQIGSLHVQIVVEATECGGPDRRLGRHASDDLSHIAHQVVDGSL